MEEDVEGIDSLGPDLKEEHRRSFNGALGEGRRLGKREKKLGVRGRKKGNLTSSPAPCP